MSASIPVAPWPEGRHPSTNHFDKLFQFEHLPARLRDVSSEFRDTAILVLLHVPDGPETTTCLRKLLEAKDCAVRAALM